MMPATIASMWAVAAALSLGLFQADFSTSSPAAATRERLLLYHMNSHTYGPDPTNMDLGDMAGDLFFDLHTIFGAFICSDQPKALNATPPRGMQPTTDSLLWRQCDNREVFGNDIVLTKLELEVDTSEGYGTYARCNVCVNGTSPINNNHSCEDGTYVCDCGGFMAPDECTDPRVGRESLLDFWGPRGLGRYCDHPRANTTDGTQKYVCAAAVSASRLGGYWYSTLQLVGKPRTWSLQRVIKTVHKQCHQSSFLSAIQARGDPACFQACFPNGVIVQNITDPCYVTCLAHASLGADALNSSTSNGGMSKEELMDAWGRPFESSDPERGGCPDVGPETQALSLQ